MVRHTCDYVVIYVVIVVVWLCSAQLKIRKRFVNNSADIADNNDGTYTPLWLCSAV